MSKLNRNFLIAFIICFVLIFVTQFDGDVVKWMVGGVICSISILALPYGICYMFAKESAKLNAMSPDERVEYEKETQRRLAEYNEIRVQRKTIVRTQILDTGSSTYKVKGSVLSAGSRAIVGGALAGTVGALVGASTGKSKIVEKKSKEVRFLVEYKDGHKSTETVKVDSSRYKKLIQYM